MSRRPAQTFAPEMIPLVDLKPHPRNYQKHPADQLAHIRRSIEEHGFYRNIVVADDLTILAGHGVVEAATELGLAAAPGYRMPYGPDDPRAMKILTGDNELGRLAEVDDRLLTEILRDVRESDDLLGTGYNDETLSALVFISRAAHEIADFDAASQWVGLPDFPATSPPLRLVIQFETPAAREKLADEIGVTPYYVTKLGVWSAWWPPRGR